MEGLVQPRFMTMEKEIFNSDRALTLLTADFSVAPGCSFSAFFNAPSSSCFLRIFWGQLTHGSAAV